MNKLRILLLALWTFLSCWQVNAQVSVGLRDSQYLYGEYSWNNGTYLKLEESVFSTNPKYQYLRGYIGFDNIYKVLDYSVDAFYGRVYNGAFYSLGLYMKGGIHFNKFVTLRCIINPLYDSGLDYTTCYEFSPYVRLTNDIRAFVGYTTIPDYRMSEKRIKGGLNFASGNLEVTPYISIPIEGNNRMKSVRVRVSMKYRFGQ
jgi:hypothetical protein